MKNKVVVITGGSSGIGEALAYKFCEENFDVVIGGTNREKIKSVISNINEKGGRGEGISHDVSSSDDVKKMVDLAVNKFGRIDVLICNAGISIRSLFEDVDIKTFEKLFGINFLGSVYSVKYSLPHIIQSSGSIIAISSLNGFIATPTRTAYVSSKHAIQGFFDSLRLELQRKNVHVMVASPGYVHSNFRKNTLKSDGKKEGETSRDNAKMMSPEEVAEKVFRGYVTKKRDLIFTFRGKLAHLIKNWFPKVADRLAYNEILNERESLLKNY
ncbi:MAG: SDR family oxidoreductase [Pelagibacteraceae bacterium TMED267]|nr:short chain dehydrogenase [Marinoscillum sp.]OUX26956.1 MAG: short chain dehydrogenase [Flammeovirgaceae bacterium TMED262]RPG06124.1 MAG: SDR family oxidoreductase [Pelagibacteraceae bacterium TMED267]|tara:strand:- start:5189 stop:6001 length:813 start_codon:yes stop_codon:yes gene_type:complete